MGLAARVIPSLLCRGDTLVKGRQFDSWRSVGHVLQAARVHAARGVDELVMLDIGATPEGRGPNLKLVGKLTEAFYTPITVGGGVRTVEDVRAVLNAGADKVAIGSAVFHTTVVEETAKKFGSQAVVVAIDVRDGRVWSECGRNAWQMSPRSFARTCEYCGAGEILLTSIEREGMMTGYDTDLINDVAAAVSIPVVAHGGAGTYEHLREALAAGASAVAAGAMFAFTDQTPRGAAQYLASRGVEVRL